MKTLITLALILGGSLITVQGQSESFTKYFNHCQIGCTGTDHTPIEFYTDVEIKFKVNSNNDLILKMDDEQYYYRSVGELQEIGNDISYMPFVHKERFCSIHLIRNFKNGNLTSTVIVMWDDQPEGQCRDNLYFTNQ